VHNGESETPRKPGKEVRNTVVLNLLQVLKDKSNESLENNLVFLIDIENRK